MYDTIHIDSLFKRNVSLLYTCILILCSFTYSYIENVNINEKQFFMKLATAITFREETNQNTALSTYAIVTSRAIKI